MTASILSRPSVEFMQITAIKRFGDARGMLGVIEFCKSMSFDPVRLFWINDVPAGMSRGGHANNTCSQFLICAGGLIRVEAYDGNAERIFELRPGECLHLPPRIFATETYVVPNSQLLVLCDRLYDPNDHNIDRDSLRTDQWAS